MRRGTLLENDADDLSIDGYTEVWSFTGRVIVGGSCICARLQSRVDVQRQEVASSGCTSIWINALGNAQLFQSFEPR